MGRSPCCEKAHINKGAWTKEEDDRLVAYIRAHGEGCWRSLPKKAGLLRCGKSCRLRWINYLRPGLKRGNFTEVEDELIINLHSHLGNKWSLIAGRLPGRTDNEIKNYWNTHIRRKLLSRGIDLEKHRLIHAPVSGFTMSFAKGEEKDRSLLPCEQEKIIGSSSSSCSSSSREGSWQIQKYRCPDLNLDLCLSPPPSRQQVEECTRCFSRCRGLQPTRKKCKCDAFLGLGSGSCRSLEMK
ncbi:MYB31 transcription factor31-like [Musa acuminata AAA Group]|uniref:(wild Malaysian banana) hypothetical protein n=1 Tax=Musa acuminata subsp. malaccensis TaxID=214687 RepID=A0A804ISJ6_MUSAM|nr:PREDICTED: myb-related protein Hv1-like [Musa acuminata subsp. malaccensis]CAG1843029.1 unnamed protein product [Musa acuminata subsp. malaccensis]